jgi:hypothetical protein
MEKKEKIKCDKNQIEKRRKGNKTLNKKAKMDKKNLIKR